MATRILSAVRQPISARVIPLGLIFTCSTFLCVPGISQCSAVLLYLVYLNLSANGTSVRLSIGVYPKYSYAAVNSRRSLTILATVGKHDGDGHRHTRLLISIAVHHVQLHMVPWVSRPRGGRRANESRPKSKGKARQEKAKVKKNGMGDADVCATSNTVDCRPTNKTAAAKAVRLRNTGTSYQVFHTGTQQQPDREYNTRVVFD